MSFVAHLQKSNEFDCVQLEQSSYIFRCDIYVCIYMKLCTH